MCSAFRLTGLILSDTGWGVLSQEMPRRGDAILVKVDKEETQTTLPALLSAEHICLLLKCKVWYETAPLK